MHLMYMTSEACIAFDLVNWWGCWDLSQWKLRFVFLAGVIGFAGSVWYHYLHRVLAYETAERGGGE